MHISIYVSITIIFRTRYVEKIHVQPSGPGRKEAAGVRFTVTALR